MLIPTAIAAPEMPMRGTSTHPSAMFSAAAQILLMRTSRERPPIATT